VKQQTDADDIKGPSEKQQNHVGDHRVIGVQRMEVDAAAIGLKNRIGEQMV